MAFKDASVTVFQVLTPVSFMIKETPGAAMSPSGRAFLFLEARLRMLYTDGAATPVSPLPPPVGSIVLGMKPEDGQWNRVRVNRIFETREGYQAQVTLVDFGEKRIVPCSALCEVPSEEFLEVPFQCVRFSLRGLKKRGQSTDGQGAGAGNDDAWDAAALEFVETALDSCSGIVRVKVTGQADSGELWGELYIDCDGGPVSLAEELVKHGYASWDLGSLAALPAEGSKDDVRRSQEDVRGGLVESGPSCSPPLESPEERCKRARTLYAVGGATGLSDAASSTSGDSTPGRGSSGDGGGPEEDGQILAAGSKARRLWDLVQDMKLSLRDAIATLCKGDGPGADVRRPSGPALVGPGAGDAARGECATSKSPRGSILAEPSSGDAPPSSDTLSGVGGPAVQRIRQFLESKNKEAPADPKPALDYGDLSVLHQLGEEEADSDDSDAGAPQAGSAGGGGDEDLADDVRDFQEDRGSKCMSFAEVPPDWEQPHQQFQEAVSFCTDYTPVQREWLRMGFLCHGPYPHMPAAGLEQMPFDSFVTEQLRSLGFRRPSRTQCVLWPLVMSNRNVLAVAPPHSGRTLAYLVPLMSRLLSFERDYRTLPSSGGGPLMLVLASSWEGAQRIHDQVAALQQSQLVQPWSATSGQVEYRDPRCCLLYGGGGEDGKEVELVNGAEIVVATPSSLWRLIDKYDRFVINLERCCHLVLDDADRLLDTAGHPLVERTLSEFWQCYEKRAARCHLSQVVVCADRWTPALGEFYRTARLGDGPLVVMAPFLEASAYTGITTEVHYVGEAASRGAALLGLLQGNPGRKVVVCAAEEESMVAVRQLCLRWGVPSLALHQGCSRQEVSELVARWATQEGVLLVQDSVLPMSGIGDAAVLIHYDVTQVSSAIFSLRYSCIAQHMPVFRRGGAASPAVRPVVHLLLSKDNASSAPELVDLLERLQVSPVPSGLRQLAQEEEQRRQGSGELVLCPRLKAFGRCRGHRRCPYRHRVVADVDHPPCWSHLPSEGEVRIFVTKVIDASHFYAWLVQERAAPTGCGDQPAVRKNQELQEALMLMNEFFSNKGNYRMLKKDTRPEVGQVYGLEVSTGRFQRVLVSSVEGPRVSVRHMDYGGQSAVEASRLLLLPEPLTRPAPFAVEVHCCRLQPWDGDQQWPLRASATAHRLFFRKELVGRVVLRLGPVLWLDPLVLPQRLPRLGTVQTGGQHVRAALLHRGLATDNAAHVADVRRLAQQAGLPLPSLEPTRDEARDGSVAQPGQAFLQTTDYTHVFLCTVESPSRFYVQQLQFSSCLDALEDDIQRAVQSGQSRPLQWVQPGRPCLACSETTGKWYRAQVREVSNEGREAAVFFPDYGDTARFPTDQLLTVLPSMMMLPYQAVQCSLAGVQPQGQDGWAPTAGSMLEDFGYDGSNNNRPLCLWVARQVAGGGGAYEVLLFDACLAGRASAADRLIERGLAAPTELPLLPDTPSHKAADEEETETGGEMSGLELVYHRQLEEQMFSMLGECARLMREDVLGGPPEGRRGAAERAEPSLAHSTEVAAEKPPAAAGGSSPVLGPAAQEEPQATPADKAPKLASVFGSGSSPRARVSWWQDRKLVHATVLVADAVSYRLEMTPSLLHLRAWAGGREFVLCERLFARVKPEKTKAAQGPQGIKLTLEKERTSLTWDFFTLQRKKVPYIRYDLYHVMVSDDEDDWAAPLVATNEEESSEEDKVLSTDDDFPGFVEGTRTTPFDPVAHGEWLEDIEDIEHDEDLPLVWDPDDTCEGI